MGGYISDRGAAAPFRRTAVRTKQSLDISDAETIALGSLAAAEQSGKNVSIAIVDLDGALLYFRRLDGARPYSVDLAIRKARTASALAVPTSMLEERFRDRASPSQDILALGGGLPVIQNGQCAGAVGISGGTSEEDHAIALAGVKSLQS